MRDTPTIYYVSGNQTKFQEASAYLEQHLSHVRCVQYGMDIDEIQTLDHEKVAVDKACKAWQHVQQPVLIDDGGIYFHRYYLFPGVLTKYVFQGIGYEGFMRLVEIGDRAEFVSYLVYATGPSFHDCYVFVGRCPGTICYDTEREPSSDLPYDIVFSPDGFEGSFAHLRDLGRKHEYSYRVAALKQFTQWYQSQ